MATKNCDTCKYQSTHTMNDEPCKSCFDVEAQTFRNWKERKDAEASAPVPDAPAEDAPAAEDKPLTGETAVPEAAPGIAEELKWIHGYLCGFKDTTRNDVATGFNECVARLGDLIARL